MFIVLVGIVLVPVWHVRRLTLSCWCPSYWCLRWVSVVPLRCASGRAGIRRATVRVAVRAAVWSCCHSCWCPSLSSVVLLFVLPFALPSVVRAFMLPFALPSVVRPFVLVSVVLASGALALSLAFVQPSVILAFVLVTVARWHLRWYSSYWRSRWRPSRWRSRHCCSSIARSAFMSPLARL